MKPYRYVRVLLAAAAMYVFGLPGSICAADWIPTPLVIDAKDYMYWFDGTQALLPFVISGKPAMIWLIIESRLPDNQKPVAVRNGFKGWHFVNGIDTTIYVSSSRTYDPGINLFFPWDGRGNEAAYGSPGKADSGLVPPGTYTYYLWGYDHVSARENACDFIAVGNYWEGQYNRFYTVDQNGLPLTKPLYQGSLPMDPNHIWVSSRFSAGGMFKWNLGDDPMNQSLMQTSSVFGYTTGAIVEAKRYQAGAGTFLRDDYSTFIFARLASWEHRQTVVKWRFVVDGPAEQDTTWGDFKNIEWYHPASKGKGSQSSVLQTDGDYVFMLDGGQNVMPSQHDKFRILDVKDPKHVLWEDYLDEFYMPNQPLYNGTARFSSEINRLYPDKVAGRYFVTGDWTCLQEVIDTSRMLTTGTKDPYTADGSGYVVWANSNGDFFMDMSSNPQLLGSPEQLWACIVSDPRNENNPREELCDADRKGFWVSHTEFTGLTAFGVYCPDGSGVNLMQFGDEFFSTGGNNCQKRGGGETIDAGTIYDGIYVMGTFPPNDGIYEEWPRNKTMWYASDSDAAIITDYYKVPGFDKDKIPLAFTVAQNSPNPFNPSTTISFTLTQESPVSVTVHNTAGQKVATLVEGVMEPGDHSVVWDASGFSAGVYFYTVKAGEFTKTTKMTLVK